MLIMPLFFEVNSDLKFSLEILADPIYSKLKLTQGFNEAVATATGIANEYEAHIEKEGKIRGQVRTRIIEDLDRLFTLLIVVREKLQELKKEQYSPHESISYKVPLVVRGKKYTGQGTIQKKDIATPYTFSSGYGALILSRFKNLLINCYEVLNGQEMRSSRIQKIFLMFDDLFYNILVMRYKLRNLLIDR
jgi:hypothetical protein